MLPLSDSQYAVRTAFGDIGASSFLFRSSTVLDFAWSYKHTLAFSQPFFKLQRNAFLGILPLVERLIFGFDFLQ